MPSSQAHNGSSNANVPMSLERKLELLESRFTQPSGGSLDAAQHQLLITTSDAGVTTASSSQHSFSFGASSASQQESNLPSSFVRSRRRGSLNSGLHALERATARHLRKVAANSPIQGTSSNLSSMSRHSTSSQQTLLTSHVQPRPRIVAESPPVPVTPGPAGRNTNPTPKPAAARTLLNSSASTSSNTRTKPAGLAHAELTNNNATTSGTGVSLSSCCRAKIFCLPFHRISPSPPLCDFRNVNRYPNENYPPFKIAVN